MEKYREIEKSIIKKYRKDIWSKFVKGIKEYNLISENDKIAVCISGGKDSFLLAKCMQELKRHGIFKFDLEFILMNPGYKKSNLSLIEANALLLDIPLIIFDSNIFEVVKKHGKDEPCYLCARMRRGHLYDQAKKLGCNKIALAHHFDDVIETTMMNLLYNGQIKTMLPKLRSSNFSGLELIRPFYLIEEASIIKCAKYNELNFLSSGCEITDCSSSGKRSEVKELIKLLDKNNLYAKKNIFSASSNINLNQVLQYEKDGVISNFQDDY